MGFLFPVASEVYFEEAEGNKRPTSASLLWFVCLPGIALWDARSESIYWKETKDQQARACYGLYACQGLPNWDARSESICWKETKDQQARACYGFHACPGLPYGMHAVNPLM